MGLQINIDNGGTLTDICIIDGPRVDKTKVLTTPYDLSKCFFEGLEKASGVVYGKPDVRRLLEEVDLIRYSTTQGTNAICERKGPRLGLIVDAKGSRLLEELAAHDPDVYAALVGDRVVLLDSALVLGGDSQTHVVGAINKLTAAGASRIVVSFGGADFIAVESAFRKVALRKYPRHLLGAVPMLYGSDLSVDKDPVRRTWTALINSFLHPGMEAFLYNAENRLRQYRTKNPLLIFRNDGDASRVAKTIAIKTYSSGPRGGVEGVKAFSRMYGYTDVVAIDVGGTTTDICQYLAGGVAEDRRGHVEGISVSFPLCEIVSAGAGGSSIIKVVDHKIVIGPESVGAVPGPACFGRGGQFATITDASLLMGLFDPKSYFGGGMGLDLDRAATAVAVNVAEPLGLKLEEALQQMELAFEAKVAAELHRATKISKDSVLLAFGGAGPLNACGVAEVAGIDKVAVPHMAAVFSAYGIGTCDISQRYTESLTQHDQRGLDEALAALQAKAGRDMYAEGFEKGQFEIEARLVATDAKGAEASYPLTATPVFPAAIGSATTVELELAAIKRLRADTGATTRVSVGAAATSVGVRKILARGRGRIDVPVYQLGALKPGDHAPGPAIVEEDYFTCRVLEGWTFVISDAGDILLNRKA
jgi:N-methylhydantoinase A/oxoprolinase/acetone carboxylase beta subunit